MIHLCVLLLMFIDVSGDVRKKPSTSTIYRLPTPIKTGDKVILVNFFGQPGIQVLHTNTNYTDVKIPRKYKSGFARLGIFKKKSKMQILPKEYYFGADNSGISHVHERRSNYILENPDEDVDDFEEDDNYFTAPFRGFLNYKSIVDYLKYLTRTYSNNVRLIDLGTTSRNRIIYGVVIKSGIVNSTSVFIEGGTIARQWMSITMALYVIKEIGTNISAYPTLKNLDWIIVPIVNPDGYEYSYRNKKHRLWEKNRNCRKKCKVGACGVNVDRNFPHYYTGIGASLAPCSNLYLGPSALSELESRSIQSIMMANRHTLKLYIGLRSFGSYILYPWGLHAEKIFDASELIHVAQTAANAMYKTHKGTHENYTVGNYADIKYPASGNIMDFARGVINIKYSYVIFLRANGSGVQRYTPESTEILDIISECFQGIRSLADHVNSRYPAPKGNLRQRRNKRKRHLNSACSKVMNLGLFLLIFFTNNS